MSHLFIPVSLDLFDQGVELPQLLLTTDHLLLRKFLLQGHLYGFDLLAFELFVHISNFLGVLILLEARKYLLVLLQVHDPLRPLVISVELISLELEEVVHFFLLTNFELVDESESHLLIIVHVFIPGLLEVHELLLLDLLNINKLLLLCDLHVIQLAVLLVITVLLEEGGEVIRKFVVLLLFFQPSKGMDHLEHIDDTFIWQEVDPRPRQEDTVLLLI
mmetsp:Transcript_1406/g.1883  ORF Transcript_1406/g.1883 Transcript_1406/m.1883 type:complete len:218 (-) Transcript_1406:928-1581(-)